MAEGGSPPIWLFAAFPIVFAAMWLGITLVMHHISGWDRLMRAFPDRDDMIAERFNMVSGMMGDFPPFGVQYGNCLTLDACGMGLRVKVWRIFGPNSQPFYVPWLQVFPRKRRILFFTYCQLGFGNPEAGHLTISRRTARKIARASAGRLELSLA